jgi:hypothetical protein
MAGENTFTTANGLFKRVYDKKVRDLRPKTAILQRLIDFNDQQKLGESYQISVMLRPPNGFTYAGSSGGVTSLKQPRNMVSKQASLVGSEIDLREQISYKALSSAVEAGEGAFKSITSEIVSGMQNASSNRVEAALLHGQRGYGTVESINDLGSNTGEIVLTDATWSGMWWAFGEGATLDSFTGTTKNNATGALVITDNGIDAANRKLTVTYSGTFSSEVAAGDILWPEGANAGASSFNEMAGLCPQAANTSGTSLGLSAAVYSNWKGNTKAVNGPPSHQVVEEAIGELRDRGAQGQLMVFCASKAYSQLIVELAQLRQFDQSYSTEKAKQGFKSVSYFSPEVEEVAITYHPFMKRSEMLILPIEECERVGSSDITFGVPGMKEEFFTLVQGSNAVELQNFTDQAVALKKPNFSYLLTGLTYT